MFRKFYLIIFLSGITTVIVNSQTVIKTTDLFKRIDSNSQTGRLNIIQDPSIDTLMNRYILSYKNLADKNGFEGMDGFRIQIYNSSNRDAKIESGKALQDFLSKFPENKYPELKPYQQFALPGYYKIRLGDFRTKTEAMRLYLLISKAFPNAYIVPDIINFPDPNIK